MAMLERLNSTQMASFAARGFVRFDGYVPEPINAQFMEEADVGGAVDDRELMANNRIPEVLAGTPLMDAYGGDLRTAMQRLRTLVGLP